MKLIEQLQQQAAPKGVEFDELMKVWQHVGANKVPEKVYQVLTQMVGKEVALDAFKEIGISFQQHEAGPAKVLDKNVAAQFAKYAKTLSPDRLRALIQTIEGGNTPQTKTQQKTAQKPQNPQQVQQTNRPDQTQAAKSQPTQSSSGATQQSPSEMVP